MHGHGFMATAYAAVPADWVAYGGEVAALQRQVDRCTGLLTYGVLNDQLAQPTDENLARWIRARLDAPGIDRVAVQSTANQGVEVDTRETTRTSGDATAFRRRTGCRMCPSDTSVAACTGTASR